MARRELIIHPLTAGLLSLEGVAAAAHMHVELVEHFVDYGLLEPARVEGGSSWFEAAAIGRLRKIDRLRRDLGINLPAVAVVLQLVDEIESLKRELALARRRLAERARNGRAEYLP